MLRLSRRRRRTLKRTPAFELQQRRQDKDRSVSTENVHGALVTEYQQYTESVLREKSYALNMADRELIRLAVFDPHGVNDARELIATIMAAIDEAVEMMPVV